GFEPRGTILSDRSTAWVNLLKSTRWNGPLTFYPGSIVTDITNDSLEAAQWQKEGKKSGNDSEKGDETVGPWLELETEERSYGSLHDSAEESEGGLFLNELHMV
ncbi:dispatched-like protein 1, partial [Trichonephila clavata]